MERLRCVRVLDLFLQQGNDSPYGLLIEQGIIPTLIVGLQCPSVNVNLECAWILGNIASGTAEQVGIDSK